MAVDATITWFITGASRGLGRALAEAVLVRSDDNVVATARHREDVATLIEQFPGRVLCPCLDVLDAEAAERAVEAAIDAFGAIDVLVNNAGYGLLGAFEELSDARVRQQFDVNLFGAMDVTRAVLPGMRRRGSGYILQISGMAGQSGLAGYSAYNASKFAPEGWSEALAVEVQEFDVDVAIVEPGQFRTDWAGSSLVRAPQRDDYAASPAGDRLRRSADAENGTQLGDPRRAAQVLMELVRSRDRPLRLPLGRDSVEEIRSHLLSQEKELTKWEALATSTDLEG